MTSKKNSDSQHESGSDPPFTDMSILDELFPSLGNGDSSSSHFTSQLAMLLNTLNSSDDENGPSLFNPLQLSPPRLNEIHALAAASLVSQTQEAIMQEYNITEFDLYKFDVAEIETICSDETEGGKEQMSGVNQENKGHNPERNPSFASGNVGHCLLSKSTLVEDSNKCTDECKNVHVYTVKGNVGKSLNTALPKLHTLVPNLLLTSAQTLGNIDQLSDISHEDLSGLQKVRNLCDTSRYVSLNCSDASKQKSNSDFMQSSNLTSNLSTHSCNIKQTEDRNIHHQQNHEEKPRSDGNRLNNNLCKISFTKTSSDSVNETQNLELNSKKRKLEFEDATQSSCYYNKNFEKLKGRSFLTSIKETCDKKLQDDRSPNVKDGDSKPHKSMRLDNKKAVDRSAIHHQRKQMAATSIPHSGPGLLSESTLDDSVVFACHICAAVFDCMAELEEHASSHHIYPCPNPSCGRTFTYRSHLSYHLHTHTGEKSFQCVECGKLFTKAQHLDVHMRSHQNEKMFNCKDCDKSFHTAGNLKNHTRIHSGDKPYTCDINGCNRSFAELSSLKKHKVTHTGERSYRCDVCGKCFTQAGSRSYHMKKHKDGTEINKKKQLKKDGIT